MNADPGYDCVQRVRNLEEVIMTVMTWDSRAARENWRTLLDAATSGHSDVVITRHGRPAAALIAYEAIRQRNKK